MKFVFISLFMSGCLSAVAFWPPGDPVQRSYRQYERDRDVILEVVEQEAYATYDQDAPRRSRYWTAEPDVRNHEERVGVARTPPPELRQAAHNIRANLDDNLRGGHPKITLKDVRLRIYEDSAWVRYNLHPARSAHQSETRLLEKHGRRWRIVYQGWL